MNNHILSKLATFAVALMMNGLIIINRLKRNDSVARRRGDAHGSSQGQFGNPCRCDRD